MSDGTARALLAGFLCGAAVAFATTFIALLVLSRSSVWQRLPQNRRVPLPLMGVVAVNLLMLSWTALGLVLGAVYLRAASEYPAGALLTPNRAFAGLVLALTASALVAVFVVFGRPKWPALTTAGIALVAFGWVLPALAR